MMDFMAGPPPEGAAPPMDLMAALGGGAPGLPQEAPPEQAGPGSEIEALDAILAAIEAYKGISTVDESERLQAEKMSTIAQQLKAQNEKMTDQVTGASPALRKALGPA